MQKLSQQFIENLKILNKSQKDFEYALYRYRDIILREFDILFNNEVTPKEKSSQESLVEFLNKLIIIIDAGEDKRYLTFDKDTYVKLISKSEEFSKIINKNEEYFNGHLNDVKEAYKAYYKQIRTIISYFKKIGYKESEIHIGSIGLETVEKYSYPEKYNLAFGYLNYNSEVRTPKYTIEDVFDGNPLYNSVDNCPYKVVIGDVIFYGIQNVPKFEDLDIVSRHLIIQGSETENQSLGSIKIIGGCCTVNDSDVSSLGNVKYIGEDLVVAGSNVEQIDGLYINGDLGNDEYHLCYFKKSGPLKSIGSSIVQGEIVSRNVLKRTAKTITANDIEIMSSNTPVKDCDNADRALYEAIEQISEKNMMR